MTEACAKVAYNSRDAASRARRNGRRARKRGRRQYQFDQRLTPYQCPRCGKWHLTSTEGH